MPHPSSRFRAALLPVDHPLASQALTQRTQTWLQPSSVNEKLIAVWEQQQITNLISDYMYTLDSIMVDPTNAFAFQNLFTDDCEVTYPFGKHRGRQGLAQWCVNAEARFARMMHLSANVVIRFPDSHGNQARGELLRLAHGRSNLYAACGLDETDLSQNFQEGGWYYWSFRKEDDGAWKISHVFLDVNWTIGNSKGLNEGDHHLGGPSTTADRVADAQQQSVLSGAQAEAVAVNAQPDHPWHETQWNQFTGVTFEGNSYTPPASASGHQPGGGEQQWMDTNWNSFADTFADVTYRQR